jgi:hypothetical protein
MDFLDLYPSGIRIPTSIYQKLKIVIANDAKVLKKLNITDFSLVLGIRHLDMTETQLMQRRPTTGIAALLHMSSSLGLMDISRSDSDVVSSTVEKDISSLSISYLKPLEMLHEKIDTNFYYNDDSSAYASLPIPGIINQTNQRVYLYFALVDMLQTFDSFKLMDHTFRKLTDYNRHLEYSVIHPDEYEKRINQFLFEHVFIDANDDFPWTITDVSKSVAEINNEEWDNKEINQRKPASRRRPHSLERENSETIIELRF